MHLDRALQFLAIAVGLALALPSGVGADEFDQFAFAKNAYDVGDYGQAVTRFEELLRGGLHNPALVLECHKLAGVSYLFVGDEEQAEKQFLALLTLSPKYTLDSMIFPIEVVDFFSGVKQKTDAQLEALARAKAGEEAKRRADQEARRREEIEKLRRNVYIERERKKNSLIVAVMPFGAGQFQNGERLKGALFLGGEILLGATAAVTFFLHEGLRPRSEEPFSSAQQRKSYERLELGYRITNQAALVALGAVMVVGIVDSLYNFEAERTEWNTVDEQEVPERLRPGKTRSKIFVLPSVGENSLRATFSVWF